MEKLNGEIKENSTDNLLEKNIKNLDITASGGVGSDDPSTECPKFGVKLKFNHLYPETRTQNIRPSVRQSILLLPLVWR